MNAEDRANELYWGSDRSVNQIADEMDLSKGALYEMIRPLPAGRACPECGTPVVHSNRTAKERGRVDCPACNWDGDETDTVTPATPTARPVAVTAAGERRRPTVGLEPVDDIYPLNDFDATGPPPAAAARQETDLRRLIAGGACLGAAVGLALVIWARRR